MDALDPSRKAVESGFVRALPVLASHRTSDVQLNFVPLLVLGNSPGSAAKPQFASSSSLGLFTLLNSHAVLQF